MDADVAISAAAKNLGRTVPRHTEYFVFLGGSGALECAQRLCCVSQVPHFHFTVITCTQEYVF